VRRPHDRLGQLHGVRRRPPGKPTYKEYELLRFLATNPDTVFTRETLLNKVWGYDFYGGARTVDVHVRRLRSKIEDRSHSFIETVRNVGYRFRSQLP
jgi:DNA-binding response OmpR family regulator